MLSLLDTYLDCGIEHAPGFAVSINIDPIQYDVSFLFLLSPSFLISSRSFSIVHLLIFFILIYVRYLLAPGVERHGIKGYSRKLSGHMRFQFHTVWKEREEGRVRDSGEVGEKQEKRRVLPLTFIIVDDSLLSFVTVYLTKDNQINYTFSQGAFDAVASNGVFPFGEIALTTPRQLQSYVPFAASPFQKLKTFTFSAGGKYYIFVTDFRGNTEVYQVDGMHSFFLSLVSYPLSLPTNLPILPFLCYLFTCCRSLSGAHRQYHIHPQAERECNVHTFRSDDE